MSDAPRRTQRERREATIAKLLEATIECLCEYGYRDTSIARICKAAGVSHGGLFRHFPSRTALIAAATDEIGRRHVAQFYALLEAPPTESGLVETMVQSFREAARSPNTTAWREVIVAARTNKELREAVAPTLKNLEEALMAFSSQMPGAPTDPRAVGTVVLSLLHMFDSEANTSNILITEDVQELRHQWAVQALASAMGVTG